MKQLHIALCFLAPIFCMAQLKISSVYTETENGDTLSGVSTKTTIAVYANKIMFTYADGHKKTIPIKFFGPVEYGRCLLYKTYTTMSGKTIFISPADKWIKIDTGCNISTLFFSENIVGDPTIIGNPSWHIIQSKEDFLQDSILTSKSIYQSYPSNYKLIPYKP